MSAPTEGGAGPVTGDVTADDTADGTWHRLHPLTPLVRGWKVVAVLVAVIAQQRGDELVSHGLPSRQEALISLAVIAGAALVGGVYALLAWQRAAYRVEGDTLQLHTGVLFRQQRQARLDRLQAIDVVRPLLARFFGLAELKLEVAGGKDSAISLSLLREADAQQLRNTLLARAAGVEYVGQVAPEAPEHEVLTVSVPTTLESFARSGVSVVAVLALAAGVVTVAVTREPAVLAGFLPVVLGVGGTAWARFTSAFGFRVATSPDGIRLHHGLLTTRAQTVPPGRVQVVRLRQPLLWRSRDWWKLEVNVAGYSGGRGGSDAGQDSAGQENVLLTVGSRAEALLVLRLALPALAPSLTEDAAGPTMRAIKAGLTGTDTAGGFVVAPRRTRWIDPIGWRRHGVSVLDDVLLMRRGVLVRELDVVPHARTQSLGVRQGPLQRRLGVATFEVHSTQGPIAPSVAHLPTDVAGDLLDQQAERGRAARARRGDLDQGRWMQAPGGPR
ncbi:PH domain-containing protein [Angustibacter sp. Root456]|uniref:PH domain-containing protein n=1 Tax=Angustibacter sp. Root456 TaxID=1736539 RepID=UPI0009E79616|nr:PH domain-containing protein [Angustibacter sp. Root456]